MFKKRIEILVILVLSMVLAVLMVGTSLGTSHGSMITFGESHVIVPNEAIIGTQVDRVIRDIQWEGSKWDIKVDPRKQIVSPADLVPYMEGKLSAILMTYAKANVVGLGPTFAIKMGKHYYAENGENRSGFKIDPSKTAYKTAIFNSTKEMALFPDSHGFNMIAGSAVKYHRKKKMSLAIACMDTPEKADAALYMAKNGINCYGPCDRFAYKLIGYKRSIRNAATIMGTAPIRAHEKGAIIGRQPLTVDTNEIIVVQTTKDGYPEQYCDTPSRYFTRLNKVYELKLNLEIVNANTDELEKVIKAAEKRRASTVAVRIYSKKDANTLTEWLMKDSSNKAILFHSAIYDEGYKMFFKFPKQTSFGDLTPIIKM